MAGVSRWWSAAGESDAVRFERAAPERRDATLALLLTGRVGLHDDAAAQFQRFARSYNLCIDELWCAARGSELLAASLIVPNAGRTGMVFLSPTSADRQALTAQLLRAMAAAQDPALLRLVQVLLDPHQSVEERAVLAAGFSPLAQLIYMERAAAGAALAAPWPPGLTAVRWSESARPLFARAILGSYEGTLDCPGLLGLRTIEDILAGHIATGRFTPELWTVLLHGQDAVGVTLLNAVPQRSAMELVYLGLTPAWRGKGLGRSMVTNALASTRARGVGTLLLAVDEANTPAIRLYRESGFVSTSRKSALILALP